MTKLLQTVFIKLAHAQGGGFTTSVKIENPLKVKSIEALIESLTGWAVGVGASLVTLMVLWGAFQILTAAGDPSKFEKGKKTILYAALGFGVLLLSGGIATLIAKVLGGRAS